MDSMYGTFPWLCNDAHKSWFTNHGLLWGQESSVEKWESPHTFIKPLKDKRYVQHFGSLNVRSRYCTTGCSIWIGRHFKEQLWFLFGARHFPPSFLMVAKICTVWYLKKRIFQRVPPLWFCPFFKCDWKFDKYAKSWADFF